MSRQSCLSANDKGVNEMSAQISWHLPYSLVKPWKTSVRRPYDEGWATSYCLKKGSLPPNDVGRIVKHVREAEGRNGWELSQITFSRHSCLSSPSSSARSLLIMLLLWLSFLLEPSAFHFRMIFGILLLPILFKYIKMSCFHSLRPLILHDFYVGWELVHH